jgi:hypothetical protein
MFRKQKPKCIPIVAAFLLLFFVSSPVSAVQPDAKAIPFIGINATPYAAGFTAVQDKATLEFSWNADGVYSHEVTKDSVILATTPSLSVGVALPDTYELPATFQLVRVNGSVKSLIAVVEIKGAQSPSGPAPIVSIRPAPSSSTSSSTTTTSVNQRQPQSSSSSVSSPLSSPNEQSSTDAVVLPPKPSQSTQPQVKGATTTNSIFAAAQSFARSSGISDKNLIVFFSIILTLGLVFALLGIFFGAERRKNKTHY